MSSKIHFKGLNGIRAIAAIIVLLSHTGPELHMFGLKDITGFEFASFGVTMFFALSGFLITYLLLMEKTNYKHVDIKKFYVRRILRIWPLYFLYLFLALLATAYYFPELLPGSAGWYFVLGANIPFIFGTAIPLIRHYWSLGVEEQFYLFWPLLIDKTKKVFRTIAIFLVAWLILKGFCRLYQIKTGNDIPYMAMQITRFDCMAIGAMGAILFFEKKKRFLQFCYSYAAQIIAWGSLVLIVLDRFHVASIIDDEILAVLVVIIIVNVASNPKTLISLENKLFDFLGRISYGIYVYHPLVVFMLSRILKNWFNLGYNSYVAAIFVLTLVSTILIAYVSYEFFEKRFLQLKTKFAKVASSA